MTKRRLTDAQLIAAYDAARVQATDAETARKGLYSDLLARTQAAGGILKTAKGVAVVTTQNYPKWDTKTLKSLVDAGKLDAGLCDPNPRPRLNVEARR
jgi:hypothetical protein